MSTIIRNGVGNSNSLKVDSKNRASTFSVVEAEEKSNNREGKTWSVYFTETLTGAGDYFFYLKNTGSAAVAISDIRIMCAATDTFNYEIMTGTPTYTGETTLTATNRNAGSNSSPSAIINKDVNITGLVSVGVLFFERCSTANVRYKLSTSSNIFISPGSAFCISAVTGTALTTCVVSLSELDELAV